MIDWTAVAGIAAASAVAVTLALFVVDSRRRAAEDRARLKREAISRLLDTMQSSIRSNQGVLASLRFWTHPNLEYAVAVPRLVHDLGPENNLISAWAFSQVQAMLAATSDKKAAAIGIQMSMKIVEWGQRTIPNQWFEIELQRNPVATDFRVPTKTSIQRGLVRMKSSTLAMSALFVIAGALIQAGRELREVAREASGLVSNLFARNRRSIARRSRASDDGSFA